MELNKLKMMALFFLKDDEDCNGNRAIYDRMMTHIIRYIIASYDYVNLKGNERADRSINGIRRFYRPQDGALVSSLMRKQSSGLNVNLLLLLLLFA